MKKSTIAAIITATLGAATITSLIVDRKDATNAEPTADAVNDTDFCEI